MEKLNFEKAVYRTSFKRDLISMVLSVVTLGLAYYFYLDYLLFPEEYRNTKRFNNFLDDNMYNTECFDKILCFTTTDALELRVGSNTIHYYTKTDLWGIINKSNDTHNVAVTSQGYSYFSKKLREEVSDKIKQHIYWLEDKGYVWKKLYNNSDAIKVLVKPE